MGRYINPFTDWGFKRLFGQEFSKDLLINFLNDLFEGEFQIKDVMRSDVQGEFEEHAEEERHHAQLLADRIIELEGVPVLDPKQWFELARCKYDSPTDFDVVSLLNQNVASERCAILRYQEIAKFTDGIDFTTCDIAKHILAEEEEHEQDLQDYLTDIARMKKSFQK